MQDSADIQTAIFRNEDSGLSSLEPPQQQQAQESHGHHEHHEHEHHHCHQEKSQNSQVAKRKLGPGSCDACRKSKRGCDGKSPCSTCVSRGRVCSYSELKQREATHGIGACDRCRKTKRACDGASPCTTCMKRNKPCTYQSKEEHPSFTAEAKTTSIISFLTSYADGWGAIFPINISSNSRGTLYRFEMSAIMAQLTRATGEASSSDRHRRDAETSSHKLAADASGSLATCNTFALLAWCLMNTDPIKAQSCCLPSSCCGQFVKLFLDPDYLLQVSEETQGRIEDFAAYVASGMDLTVSLFIRQVVIHLCKAVAAYPKLRFVVCSKTGEDVFSSLFNSTGEEEKLLLLLNKQQLEAELQLVHTEFQALSSVSSSTMETLRPLVAFSSCIQSIVELVACPTVNQQQLQNAAATAHITRCGWMDDDVEVITQGCLRNPIGVKAFSLGLMALTRAEMREQVIKQQVAVDIIRRLTPFAPSIAESMRVVIGSARRRAAATTLAPMLGELKPKQKQQQSRSKRQCKTNGNNISINNEEEEHQQQQQQQQQQQVASSPSASTTTPTTLEASWCSSSSSDDDNMTDSTTLLTYESPFYDPQDDTDSFITSFSSSCEDLWANDNKAYFVMDIDMML